jgi:hypothetical protein
MRLNYDVGGTSPTMTVSSMVVMDAQQDQSYPNSANA